MLADTELAQKHCGWVGPGWMWEARVQLRCYAFLLFHYKLHKHTTKMPPKGWRKNREGKFPQNNKDTEIVSIDEILFPKSTISKLAKEITASDNDSNMILSKDSLLAIQRAATVFVSHLLYHARNVAKEADRKNINAQDVLSALEKAEFLGFVPDVKQKLATHERNVDAKKLKKAEVKAQTADTLEDGPAAKKMKDNTLNAVEPAVDAGEETADDEFHDADGQTAEAEEDEDDEEEEDDAQPNEAKTILSKEADLTLEEDEENDV